jgi:hypothetical protein
MQTEDVVSPAGLPETEATSAASRLPDLEGKVIGEIWNGDFKGDIAFPLIRRQLRQRYPSLKIVPFTEFPHTHVSDDPVRQRERARLLASLAKTAGCDAVISGVGA